MLNVAVEVPPFWTRTVQLKLEPRTVVPDTLSVLVAVRSGAALNVTVSDGFPPKTALHGLVVPAQVELLNSPGYSSRRKPTQSLRGR